MKYASIIVVAAVIALLGRSVYLHAKADEAILRIADHVDEQIDDTDACVVPQDWVDEFTAHAGVGPSLASAVKIRAAFQINCGTIDGGVAVECGVPMDGGTAGYPVAASSVYVAPVSGSSVNVRIGPSTVTSATGFEVGSTGRDGPGLSADVTGCWCKSAGAAQRADVVIAQ